MLARVAASPVAKGPRNPLAVPRPAVSSRSLDAFALCPLRPITAGSRFQNLPMPIKKVGIDGCVVGIRSVFEPRGGD